MRFDLGSSQLVICCLTLSLVLPPTASSQDTASPPEEVRLACDSAQQALAREGAASEKVKGIATMQVCGNSGVETLATYWRRPAVDSALLPALADVSGGLNDRRTYQAARAVALNPSRPEAFRLAALKVLVSGFDRKLAVGFPPVTKPMETSYVALGSISHPQASRSSQPVGPEAKSDVLSVLAKLAASDPNERIRKVAAELGPLLKRKTKA
jgi:hypothetical protein